mmetsp:Transcript_27474/g.69925  ORF Transcript_27474/g.69925 Transcript_27474/m.69925 type:complete len:205 (+) Transcript_27474:737-1351(+)
MPHRHLILASDTNDSRLALSEGQHCLAAYSKAALFSGWSHVHLAEGSLASLRSSFVTSPIMSVPVSKLRSRSSDLISTSSFSFSSSSKTTRCLPRERTYVHSPVTLSAESSRTCIAVGPPCSPLPIEAGSGAVALGRLYAMAGSSCSLSSACAHASIFFSSHVAPPLFQAEPPALLLAASSFCASSAVSFFGGGAAFADVVLAQ